MVFLKCVFLLTPTAITLSRNLILLWYFVMMFIYMLCNGLPSFNLFQFFYIKIWIFYPLPLTVKMLLFGYDAWKCDFCSRHKRALFATKFGKNVHIYVMLWTGKFGKDLISILCVMEFLVRLGLETALTVKWLDFLVMWCFVWLNDFIGVEIILWCCDVYS